MSAPNPPAPVPPGTPPAPESGAPRPKRTLGIIALITAIVGFLFAVIPGAMIVGWILLPVAFVLAIVAIFQPPSRTFGIWALVVSVLGGVIGAIVFVAVVAGAVDEAFGEDEVTIESSAPEASDAAEGTVSQDEGTQEKSTSEEAEATDETAAEEESEDIGTRDNPAPIGSVITGEEWEVVVNSVQLEATNAVMAANTFNDPPADGEAYLIVTVTTTYLGEDSSYDSMVDVDYVTADGTVITSTDNFAVAPEPEFGMTELFAGASSTGNIVLAAPIGDDGLLRVTPGLFADDVFVALS